MNPVQHRCISRTEARSLLADAEKFDTIILDFDCIPFVGQAFVDEIYRVFQHKYPNIRIKEENVSKDAHFMIQRAKNEAKKS